MTERALYALPVDVIRKFDPTLTQSDLSNNDYIGNQDIAQIRARLDSVGSQFEDETGTAMRLAREGAPNAPETYDNQEASNENPRSPLWASLRYRPVLPFDSNQDDTLEIRTGKDSWEDVTDGAGDDFVLDNKSGRLKLYRWLVNRIFWDAPDDRFLRATYRYGALGGSDRRGGQTTLDGSIASGDTSVTVANAARLPTTGVVCIANDEYARITGVTHSTNTLTLERGIRATSAASHADGDIVHYCPETVRDGVAAKTARELLRYENFVDQLVETGDGTGAAAKLEQWENAWQRLLANNSDVRKL